MFDQEALQDNVETPTYNFVAIRPDQIPVEQRRGS
jgi:hypothetical protein